MRSLKAGRLVAMLWILITYHGIFLIQLFLGGPFTKFRGFPGDVVSISAETIAALAWYVLAFNLIFAFVENIVWRLSGGRSEPRAAWEIDQEPNWLAGARWIYLAFLIGGGIWYWFKMAGGGYRDYVQLQQSNWPVVFFWASAPLITILALLKRPWLAALACVPFLFFAVYLKVRAFALLSIIPAAVVLYFQAIGASSARRQHFFKPIAVGVAIFAALVAVSVLVTFQKMAKIEGTPNAPGEITGLPDAGMIYGSAIVFEYVRDTATSLGSDSLLLYGWNWVNPFLLLAGLERQVLLDPAVFMANIVDGVPLNSAVYFHYPTLWYGDAFLTFGNAGLLLAGLWGLIVSLWERFMTRNMVLLALLLPYYTWHAYMLVRGSPSSATVPLSYAAYVAALVLVVLSQQRFLKRFRAARRRAL
ncbi:MAG: hypothetical protein FJ197_05855 [Gammaproteobacteria bacterium]|nr:hypothetical protein [Gammaproteobacteria bacterium]